MWSNVSAVASSNRFPNIPITRPQNINLSCQRKAMESLLINAGLTTSGVAVLLLLYKVVKSIQGKKLISNCCGKKMEMGFDVGEMTPQHEVILVSNPMPPPSARSVEAAV